jgi:3-hydroxyacyl-[acyl-carrier-protein] dehydratase
MTQEEIKTILPHREDMLLLDSLEEREDVAYGTYHVRGDEWFLRGHFPGNPVVPGVILCEILAQSVGALLAGKLEDGMLPLYTGLKEVRFRSPVTPGDTIQTKCRITRAKHPFYFATGEGYVGDTLCVKADFSFAIQESQICSQKS